jgi:hypothetical protein
MFLFGVFVSRRFALIVSRGFALILFADDRRWGGQGTEYGLEISVYLRFLSALISEKFLCVSRCFWFLQICADLTRQ